MRHGALLFTVGMVLLIAGAGLRWWSFWALGEYFTFTVNVSPGQHVLSTTGDPYRRYAEHHKRLLPLIW
jgi:protein-S-isoprenylcysteine O-methyltransferase Ste14